MSSEFKISADEIHANIERRVQATRVKDVLSLMANYALDVATFDIIPPLSNLGSEVVRQRVVEWFMSFEGPIEYELRDVNLVVAGDVAFDHHTTHVRGTTTQGVPVDMWFRETVGYRHLDGAWKVSHQHSSVPFDMATGKGLLDLKP